MSQKSQRETPRSTGFYQPGEWEPHARCWMTWPHEGETWSNHLPKAKALLAGLAGQICRFEPVSMLVHPAAVEEARSLLAANVELVIMPTSDAWARDTLPVFLRHRETGELAGVRWIFNRWGDPKFVGFADDLRLAGRLLDHLGIRQFSAPLVNEGGAVIHDGAGTLLATRATLLSPARNPGRSEAEVEKLLLDFYGAEKVLWLEKGYDQDETGGHIDVVATFAAPGKILHLACTDPADPNFSMCRENLAALKKMTAADGRKLEVIEVPQPGRREFKGRRLSLSYLNFYLPNSAVIVPVFADPMDEAALTILRDVFPRRQLVAFESTGLFLGGGGVHCVTQQEPVSE